MINWPEEEELIWTITYNFFPEKILIRIKSISPSTIDLIIIGLYDIWQYFYLINFLEALWQQMQNCTYDCFDYYIKTFVIIQSSRIGKSRVADTFDKSYLVINYIFCKNDDYLFDDTEILHFILSEPLDKVKKCVNKLPQKKTMILGNSLVKTRKMTVIQNYSITMGLLYINYEIRGLYILRAFVAFTNLMCLIVNQQVEIQDSTLSLKKLVSLRYQIMTPLNLKKESNRDIAINKRNQQI